MISEFLLYINEIVLYLQFISKVYNTIYTEKEIYGKYNLI